jgi:hypothetical protein
LSPKNSILPFLHPCDLAESKFRPVLQKCHLSFPAPGTCWGVPAPNPVGKIENFRSLAYGKGDEKIIRVTILQKIVTRIFFLSRKLYFQIICGNFDKICPHYLLGKFFQGFRTSGGKIVPTI